MTEQNTSGAVVALPSIGDSAVLAEILMYTGRDAIAVMLNEQGDPNDFSRIVFGVASIFMGHTDSLELPEGWDPAARGAALRPLLSDMLENMPEEDRRTFADDESLLVLAVMTCFQEAAAIAVAECRRFLMEHPDGPEITFVCFSGHMAAIYRQLLGQETEQA